MKAINDIFKLSVFDKIHLITVPAVGGLFMGVYINIGFGVVLMFLGLWVGYKLFAQQSKIKKEVDLKVLDQDKIESITDYVKKSAAVNSGSLTKMDIQSTSRSRGNLNTKNIKAINLHNLRHNASYRNIPYSGFRKGIKGRRHFIPKNRLRTFLQESKFKKYSMKYVSGKASLEGENKVKKKDSVHDFRSQKH